MRKKQSNKPNNVNGAVKEQRDKRNRSMNNQIMMTDNDILLDIPDHIWQQCKITKNALKGGKGQPRKWKLCCLLKESLSGR